MRFAALFLLPASLCLPYCTGKDALATTEKTRAVSTTALSAAECTSIGDFYWEIGTASGAEASGSVGGSYSSATGMPVASASKIVFAAYILEKRAGSLSAADQKAMNFTSGYNSFTNCGAATTINGCFTSPNSDYTAGNDGKFYYNGGHFQKEAVDLGLGAMNNAALTTELRSLIGVELSFTFVTPQPAGGIAASPATYAAFLRKVLQGNLRMKNFLGVNAVCTRPTSCATAVYAPINESWHYANGHWIEDDPTTGDGAFSSPGLYGFYPWISADKTTYGILARYDTNASDAWYTSIQCGRKLRKAWFTGTAQ